MNRLRKEGGKRIELIRWVKHELTLAISVCVYGPGNPFRERAVEDAFWYILAKLNKVNERDRG